VDEIVHRQEMAHVGFREDQHGGLSGVIISFTVIQGSEIRDQGIGAQSQIFA
jgi:hypothetical protein